MFHLALAFSFGCWLHLDAKLNPVFWTRTTITVINLLLVFENDKGICNTDPEPCPGY